ncbi:MAG: hypothetical protein U0441_36930 [Polyangiaceae bacterium]
MWHDDRRRALRRQGVSFWGWGLLSLCAGTWVLSSCGDPSAPGADAGVLATVASPLATEPPEPLATDAGPPTDGGIVGIPADSSGHLLIPDAGAPPPEQLRADAALAPEPPGSKELAGIGLDAIFRWRDVPGAPKAPEVSADGIKEANKLTALTTHVDVTEGGRMRLEFTSRALPLPGHTELRARSDRWGHLLLWPNSTEYRVVPPGALRTLLGERRVDVTPLAAGQVKAAGDGKRLGVAVRKVDVTAPLGTLRVELGKIAEVGEGGPLLCRAFVEMLGVDPKSAACVAGEVPLFATWTWQEGGGISWRRPRRRAARTTCLPTSWCRPRARNTRPPDCRSRPGNRPHARRDGGVPDGPAQPACAHGSVGAGRGIRRGEPDGHAPLPARGRRPGRAGAAARRKYVIGTQRGRYVLSWRTFLGEKVYPPQALELPARFTIGGAGADAGAPDGGK